MQIEGPAALSCDSYRRDTVHLSRAPINHGNEMLHGALRGLASNYCPRAVAGRSNSPRDREMIAAVEIIGIRGAMYASINHRAAKVADLNCKTEVSLSIAAGGAEGAEGGGFASRHDVSGILSAGQSAFPNRERGSMDRAPPGLYYFNPKSINHREESVSNQTGPM